jgi:hypothetical protein
MSFLNPDKIYNELMVSGEDWADKDAAANLLEEGKKSLLAQLAIEEGAQGQSYVKAEALALANRDYKDYVASMVEARRVANRAKVRYGAIQVLAELRRSQESTRRAEMQIK